MPPKGKDQSSIKSVPAVQSKGVSSRLSIIQDLKKEILRIEKENEEYQKQIDEKEKESLIVIQDYRSRIDDETTKINKFKQNIKNLYDERDKLIQKFISDNEIAKQKARDEDKRIQDDIQKIQASLDIIHTFEENQEKITTAISDLEKSIDSEKRQHEDSIEQIKKKTALNLQRNEKDNQDKLQKAKEEYYNKLIDETDQAVLLHIQRRNNLENNLLSLQEMYSEYTAKIAQRKGENIKLQEAISLLHKDDRINSSAEYHSQIIKLQKGILQSRQQLTQIKAKNRAEHKSLEESRAQEIKQIDLALRLQQDRLDHKLQQIQALRELTLTVLSYRTQLEAEFIRSLGEVIFEVGERLNNENQQIEQHIGRQLVFSSSSSSQTTGHLNSTNNKGGLFTGPNAVQTRQSQPMFNASTTLKASLKGENYSALKQKRLHGQSINHILANFKLDDRITVLERFIERVQGSQTNTQDSEECNRELSPLLQDDPNDSKPESA